MPGGLRSSVPGIDWMSSRGTEHAATVRTRRMKCVGVPAARLPKRQLEVVLPDARLVPVPAHCRPGAMRRCQELGQLVTEPDQGDVAALPLHTQLCRAPAHATSVAVDRAKTASAVPVAVPPAFSRTASASDSLRLRGYRRPGASNGGQ